MIRRLHLAPFLAFLVPAVACVGSGEEGAASSSSSALRGGQASGFLPNNFPILNANGFAANHSTDGAVDIDGAFMTPQGTNGRSCGSCHALQNGWTMSAATVQFLFETTGGTHPIFNAKDADRRGADPDGTVEERRYAYSMLLKGKFIRSQAVPANAEFEVIGVDDPFGMGTISRFHFFRRSMPTANFRNHIVSWDGANTVGTELHDGLARQARGNITGAQSGTAPVDEAIVAEIVDFESRMSHAQLFVWGAGRLDAAGARGGPEHHAQQELVNGRFDLFDAWLDSNNPRRAQIARGQEIFNTKTRPNGGTCRSCHSAANDGQNVNGTFLNIGASRTEFAEADMAVYTLQNLETGEIMETTDGGRGWRTGLWADLGRFKSPSLRGLSARGEYFHNGIARSLVEVVEFYEDSLGFEFTNAERNDLVAFLGAL